MKTWRTNDTSGGEYNVTASNKSADRINFRSNHMTTCPHCAKTIPDATWLRAGASIRGKRGTGAAKARTTEQARAAAKARWAKRKLDTAAGNATRGERENADG